MFFQGAAVHWEHPGTYLVGAAAQTIIGSSCLIFDASPTSAALQETAKSTRAKTLVDKDQALVDSSG
jgi:hypothetical protein